MWSAKSHIHMSRSATPATRNDATSRWKHLQTTFFATFPIGTATFYQHVTKCHACHGKCSYVTLETHKNKAFCNFSHRYGNFPPRLKHVHMSGSATPATQNDATSRLKRAKTVLFTTLPIGTATFRHDSNTSTCHEVPRLPRKMKLRHAGNAQKQCLLQLFP